MLTKHTVGCADKMSKRVLVISISNPLQISTNLALPIPLETVPLIQKPLLPYEFSLTFGWGGIWHFLYYLKHFLLEKAITETSNQGSTISIANAIHLQICTCIQHTRSIMSETTRDVQEQFTSRTAWVFKTHVKVKSSSHSTGNSLLYQVILYYSRNCPQCSKIYINPILQTAASWWSITLKAN